MPTIRVTMLMSVGRFSWSESHWTNKYANLNTAEDEVERRLLPARSKLFGRQTSFIGYRVNTQGSLRDAQLIRPDVMPTSPFLLTGAADADGSTDIEDVAVICRAFSGTNRAKNFYIRGCPDVAEGNAFGPKKLDGQNAAFVAAKDQYFAYLSAGGWGFWGRKLLVVPQPSIGIVTDAAPPTKYGVKLAAQIAGVVVGDKIQLRGFKVRKGAPKVNGIYQVSDPAASFAGNPATYFLNNSLGIDPTAITGQGTVEPVQYEFLQYTKDAISVSYVKRHATGGRTALPLGRRKSRK